MKTAFITGATAGIGKAIAEDFSRKGYRLILTGRRNERLEKIKNDLHKANQTEILTLAFDVQNRHEVAEAVGSLPEKWQNIDILVNNAGLGVGKSYIENGELDDWDRMIDTNVKGLLYVSRAVIPLIKTSDDGHIINIGSIAGAEVYPGGNVYCATKYAINALSKSLRMELLPRGIRVSQIRPGLAETEFSKVRFKGDEARADEVYKGYAPLQPEDVARAVSFAVESPKHVCINDLEITPTAQANAYLIEKNKD